MIPEMTLDEYRILRAFARMSPEAVNKIVTKSPHLGIIAYNVRKRATEGRLGNRDWDGFLALLAK